VVQCFVALTVVIPTADRQQSALRAARSVQDVVPDAEVIIVDQSIDPLPSAQLPTMEQLRYFHTNRRGASIARNTGLDAARGEFVLFLDDDAEVTDSFGEALSLAEAGRQDAIAFVMAEFTSGAYLKRFPAVPCEISPWTLHSTAMESNMVWRTDSLRALRGFDESLGVPLYFGSDEIVDVLIRGWMNGMVFTYAPIVAFMHPRLTSDPSSKRYRYGRGTGAVMSKHLRNRIGRRVVLYGIGREFAGLGLDLCRLRLRRFLGRCARLAGVAVGFWAYTAHSGAK
jgi:glycosyltransferase involved in cell wall biosynthesis